MNKKIAIIIALMITSTTTLIGCNSTSKTDSTSSNDTFQVSSVENEAEDDNNAEDENQTDTAASTSSENKTTSNNNNTSSNAKKVDTTNQANTINQSTTTSDKSTSSNKTNNSSSSNKTTNTTSNSTKTQEKTNTGKVTTFTAKAGYSLTFPANWDGKYLVEENSDNIMVRYISSTDKSNINPWIFSIEEYKPEENDYDHFEKVGDTRFFNVGDKKYCIGGPTDIGMNETCPDFNDYRSFRKQAAEVVKSIKVNK